LTTFDQWRRQHPISVDPLTGKYGWARDDQGRLDRLQARHSTAAAAEVDRDLGFGQWMHDGPAP